MIARGLDEQELTAVKIIIGDKDPENKIRILKFSEGYIVELVPSQQEREVATRKGKPPLALKPFPCSNFDEAVEALQEIIRIIS